MRERRLKTQATMPATREPVGRINTNAEWLAKVPQWSAVRRDAGVAPTVLDPSDPSDRQLILTWLAFYRRIGQRFGIKYLTEKLMGRDSEPMAQVHCRLPSELTGVPADDTGRAQDPKSANKGQTLSPEQLNQMAAIRRGLGSL
ncbi:MAG: hypothetical protein AAGF32_05860 [Pseudomonadota bacterium]